MWVLGDFSQTFLTPAILALRARKKPMKIKQKQGELFDKKCYLFQIYVETGNLTDSI